MSPLTITELVAYLEAGGLPVDYRTGENGCSTPCLLCPGRVDWTEKLQRFVCDRPECPGHANPSLHADAFHFKCEPADFAGTVESVSSASIVEGCQGATPLGAVARMIPASARLHAVIVEHRITLPNDPELARHASDAIARHSRRGWRIDRPNPRANIDAMIALAMAVERAEQKAEPVELLGWL